MRGKIEQWKDAKGFGFIKPDSGSEKLFFHITSVKTNARRPKIGDKVVFESIRDSRQRLRAKSVVIDGVGQVARSSSRQKFVPIDPPQKNIFDYLVMLVCICSVVALGFVYFQTGVIENALVCGIPAVIAIVFLNLPKKPKEKAFSCSGCKKTVDHDLRTIQAWNKGIAKLYCKTCHHDWLKTQPDNMQNQSQSMESKSDTMQSQSNSKQNKGSGCLGALALMMVTPIAGSMCLYHWLA